MPDKPLLPLVFFKAFQNGQPKTIFGYLVRTPDGRYWCFQDEANAAGNPLESGAVQLEPQLLKEIHDENSTRQVFLYQKVYGDVPEDN